MDYVAIDFETCQKKRASPIQVGVVRVIGGVIGKAFTEFVMPPEQHRWFDPELTLVHGLSPADIAGAPEWVDILSRLDAFSMKDGHRLPLVAHNASFERSVIQQTTDFYGLAQVPFEYYCTVKLARLVDRASPNHKLNTLAARYGIEQLHHHDAGDDALVGARLMEHLRGMQGADRALSASRLR